jgi:hypothetical protein
MSRYKYRLYGSLFLARLKKFLVYPGVKYLTDPTAKASIRSFLGYGVII